MLVTSKQEEERRRGDGRTDDTLFYRAVPNNTRWIIRRTNANLNTRAEDDRAVLAGQPAVASAGLELHQDGVGRAA